MFASWGLPAEIEYQQLFFQSSQLHPTGNHNLTITNLNLNGKLILDFVNITSVATDTSTTKHLPVGKIVGGVLGGIFAAVVTVVVGVIFLKRKKNRRNQKAHGFPLHVSSR